MLINKAAAVVRTTVQRRDLLKRRVQWAISKEVFDLKEPGLGRSPDPELSRAEGLPLA